MTMFKYQISTMKETEINTLFSMIKGKLQIKQTPSKCTRLNCPKYKLKNVTLKNSVLSKRKFYIMVFCQKTIYILLNIMKICQYFVY